MQYFVKFHGSLEDSQLKENQLSCSKYQISYYNLLVVNVYLSVNN